MKNSSMSSLLAVATLGLLVACGKTPEKPQEQPKQVVIPPSLKQDWPVELMLDAMIRSHPNSRKVCHDEGHVNAFFIDYSHKEINDGFYGGWVMIWQVEFHESTNKTLYILEPNSSRYHRVYPNIDDLKCKER